MIFEKKNSKKIKKRGGENNSADPKYFGGDTFRFIEIILFPMSFKSISLSGEKRAQLFEITIPSSNAVE